VVDAVLKSLEEEDSPDHIGFPMIPSEASLLEIVDLYMTVMMPGYFGDQCVDRPNARYYLGERINRLFAVLQDQLAKCFVHECRKPRAECAECLENGSHQAMVLLQKIPELRRILAADVRAAYDGDPAAKSTDEIIFCYPGVRAVTLYRFAHELHRHGVPIFPRMVSEYAHSVTGCDIHPGAEIGYPFFIDHCTGVVIGETTVIGRNVRLYQGVTLGGANFKKDAEGKLIRDTKRHPTLEDDCVIYAGATILGGDTVIGKGSVIGGNVWLTRSVPPYTQVTAKIQETSVKPLNSEQP